MDGSERAVAPPMPAGQAVYLAEVTDDLDTQREEVKGFLLQAGLRVFPQSWYPRDDLAAYQAAVDAELDQCKFFAQLLSGVSGKRPPGWPQGYPGVQYERARRVGKPILQWRSHELKLADVVDPQHRALLEGDTVWATGIEEFKRAAVAEGERMPAAAPPMFAAEDLIFVNTDWRDFKLAEEIGRRLQAHGVLSALPLQKGEPAEIRKDLEANLGDCDGLMLIYGEADAGWVRSQLRQGRKILAQRGQPVRCVAVCQGPPTEKDDLNFFVPNLLYLDFRDGIQENGLQEFIRCLRS